MGSATVEGIREVTAYYFRSSSRRMKLQDTLSVVIFARRERNSWVGVSFSN